MTIGHIGTTVLVAVAGVVIFLLVLRAVSQRLLQVRLGKARTGLATVVGLGAELGFESQVVWADPEPTFALIPLQIGIVFLVAIACLVLTEFIVPIGSVPRPDRWVNVLRGQLARSRRYSQIVRIATRHRLLPAPRLGRSRADQGVTAAESARSLRLALQEAGVVFVKLGQQLSTRSDLLPAEFVAELSRLQQQVQPVPWADVETVLTAELGASPEDVFATFDSDPLAAASISQAHRARLHDGTNVVVKVQRPGIRAVVERDLDIALRLARSLQHTTDWGRGLRVTEVAEGFATALREELDFRVEAENMAAVATAASRHPTSTVMLPARFEQLSTGRVLVAEFLAGKTLSEPESIHELPMPRRERDAHELFEFLLRQVMIDGVFHADPHPGNIMMLDDGRVALLDFGSAGRIDAGLRGAMQQLFLAVERDDPQQLTDALFELVIRPDQLDEQRLRRDLGRFMARHLSHNAGVDLSMFSQLIRLLSAHELAVPTEVAAAFRAFATLDGTLRQLHPEFDMVSQAREFATEQLQAGTSPAALRTTLTDELTTLLPLLRRLPRRLDQVSAALEDGRLRLNIRLLADSRDRDTVTGWLHLAALTFLGGTTGVMATLLLGTDTGPSVTPTMTLFQLFGYLLVVLSAIMVLRVLFDIFRSRRRD